MGLFSDGFRMAGELLADSFRNFSMQKKPRAFPLPTTPQLHTFQQMSRVFGSTSFIYFCELFPLKRIPPFEGGPTGRSVSGGVTGWFA